MRIIDEFENDIKDPDLTKGYLTTFKTVKKDAIDPDDITKFHYEEDDYELVQMYIVYKPGELDDRKKGEVESQMRSQLKTATSMFVQAANFDDITALSVSLLYDDWRPYDDQNKPIHYIKDGIRRYEDELYRCKQEHDSQLSWNPKDAHSLWVKIVPPGEIPKWEPVIPGVFDGYELGQKVTHNGKTWESTFNGLNVWEPGVVGTEALWKEV